MVGEIGYGAHLKVGATVAATEATVLVAGITNVPVPKFTRDKIDGTHSESPNNLKEYFPGMAENGDLVLELNWVPNDATDDIFMAMRTEKTGRLCEVEFTQVTPNVTCTFRAWLMDFDPSVPVPDKMTATVTLVPTTMPVWAEVV